MIVHNDSDEMRFRLLCFAARNCSERDGRARNRGVKDRKEQGNGIIIKMRSPRTKESSEGPSEVCQKTRN